MTYVHHWSADLDARLAQLEQRVRRGWLSRFVPAAALICGGSVAAGVAGGVGFASIAVGLLVEAVAVAGLIAWMLTFGLSRRPGRPDSIPIVLGLSRTDRRTVYRDLRNGRPSDDPLLLAVECRTASRAMRRQHLRWICVAVAVVELALAATQPTYAAQRLLFVAFGVLAVFLCVRLHLVVRRANRFI